MDFNRTYYIQKRQARRQQVLQRREAEQILRQRRNRPADPRSQILAAFEGQKLGPLSKHILRNLGTITRPIHPETRDALRRLLLRVHDECYLFGALRSRAQAVIRLGLRHQNWIRQPEDWKASGRYARWLASLARHLFARYDVPRFMDAARSSDSPECRRQQEWFLHVARGENLRHAPDLPLPLTKMMAHHICRAPDECMTSPTGWCEHGLASWWLILDDLD